MYCQNSEIILSLTCYEGILTKKNAEIQRVRQQIKDVGDYLDGLVVKILEAEKQNNIAWLIYAVVCVTWIFAAIWGPVLEEVGHLCFFVAIMYAYYRQSRLAEVKGEFRGGLKVLELLGMIPPLDGDSQREAKRAPFWAKGKEMVQSWAKQKEKAREVYAPA